MIAGYSNTESTQHSLLLLIHDPFLNLMRQSYTVVLTGGTYTFPFTEEHALFNW